MKWIDICVLIALAAFVAISTPVFAAPGGKGLGHLKGSGNNNGNTDVVATVSATPDPAQAWSTVSLEGCGYHTDRAVEIHVVHGTATETWGAGVWAATGCFSGIVTTAEPGTYAVEVYQTVKRKTVLMGEGSFEVQ